MSDFNVGIDLLQLRDIISRMNSSRENMHNAIVSLNQIRKQLEDGETWAGAGAQNAMEVYNHTLSKMLTEHNRLKQLTTFMGEYAIELEENERATATSANNVAN